MANTGEEGDRRKKGGEGGREEDAEKEGKESFEAEESGGGESGGEEGGRGGRGGGRGDRGCDGSGTIGGSRGGTRSALTTEEQRLERLEGEEDHLMRILSSVVSKIMKFEVSEKLEYSDTSFTDTQVTIPRKQYLRGTHA